MLRTRSQRHRFGLPSLVGAAVLATALTGCGAGQISQTANQSSAINGGSANVGTLALRNVHLVGSPDPIRQRTGQKMELVLVVANQSADFPDRLVSISSPDDVGSITLGGDTDIPATGRLFVGAAEGQEPGGAPQANVTEQDQARKDQGQSDATVTHGNAQVQLTKDLADGLTYRFTFTFEKAGAVTVAVPIDAGPSAPREHTGTEGSH